jgi:hypothetical protein
VHLHKTQHSGGYAALSLSVASNPCFAQQHTLSSNPHHHWCSCNFSCASTLLCDWLLMMYVGADCVDADAVTVFSVCCLAQGFLASQTHTSTAWTAHKQESCQHCWVCSLHIISSLPYLGPAAWESLGHVDIQRTASLLSSTPSRPGCQQRVAKLDIMLLSSRFRATKPVQLSMCCGSFTVQHMLDWMGKGLKSRANTDKSNGVLFIYQYIAAFVLQQLQQKIVLSCARCGPMKACNNMYSAG